MSFLGTWAAEPGKSEPDGSQKCRNFATHAGLAVAFVRRRSLMVDQKIFIFLSKDEGHRSLKNFGHTGAIPMFGSGTNVA
jgi:hypothetical protein